ncbi:MAG TPA: hypothetical protein PLQ36_00290 [Candidatus Gracilibacteria bacterium]|nr:hypothetical protein [Candidatus Gracilibacteria bacterium]
MYKNFLLLLALIISTSACTKANENLKAVAEIIPAPIKEVVDTEKSVNLRLEKTGSQITLWLDNPAAKEIQSVRTWLAFPAQTLLIKNFKLNYQEFSLIAPSENKIDLKNGMIKIGLASLKTVRKTSIKLASFQYIKTQKKSIPLTCFDYREESDSHCLVLDNAAQNILAPVSGLIID